MIKFHFGSATHWKLRLLMNPLWLIFPSLINNDSHDNNYYMDNGYNGNNDGGTHSLYGCNQSWHIANWANDDIESTTSTTSSVHSFFQQDKNKATDRDLIYVPSLQFHNSERYNCRENS